MPIKGADLQWHVHDGVSPCMFGYSQRCIVHAEAKRGRAPGEIHIFEPERVETFVEPFDFSHTSRRIIRNAPAGWSTCWSFAMSKPKPRKCQFTGFPGQRGFNSSALK